MQIFQTKYQLEMAQYPSKLDFETIAFHRGLFKTNKEKFNYYRTQAGVEGEAVVLEYLEKYGKPHWVVIQNLWKNYSGKFECDLILLTSHKGYACEIKNLKRRFSYNEGITKINGRVRSMDPIH